MFNKKLIKPWRKASSMKYTGVMACLFSAVILVMNTGCDAVGAIAYHAQGPGDVEVKEADSGSLNESRLAVFVNAPPSISSQFPNLRFTTTKEVNYRLVNGIAIPHEETSEPTDQRSPGLNNAKIIDAKSVTRYQNSDIWWNTLAPSELGAKFKLQKLVIIDIQEFSTHEQGNPTVKRGRVSAIVRVYDLQSSNPDAAVYENQTSVLYPQDKSIVDPKVSQAEVAGVITEKFADQVAGFFLTHSIWVPNR